MRISVRWGEPPPLLVYEDVSTKPFPTGTATGYDWAIQGQGSDIEQARGVYVDKTRQYFIVLNASAHKILIYDLAAVTPPSPPGKLTTLDSLDLLGTFSGEDALGNDIGFILGTAMTVDEAGGFLYVAADCNFPTDCPNQQPNGNSIFIYDLKNLSASPRVIGRGCLNRNASNSNNRGCEIFDNIKLNRPFGIHYDPGKDVLYVTNIGTTGSTAHTVLAFDHPSSLGGTLAECDTDVASNASTPSRCANISPNRILSSSTTFTDSERMQSPTAPYVNPVADRLFLINWEKNSLFIFENASTRFGETRPDRIISGGDTQLAFSSTGNFTGALFVDTSEGKEVIFVGQPPPGCTSCQDGAFLVFGLEGDIPPSRTWSGGEAVFTGPSALAVDTERDILYIANQGDAAQTTDDSLSILTGAGQANGTLPMTGTLSVTNNSAEVTGTGTIFTTEFAAGDSIKIGTGTYRIASVASDTALTLTTAYSGETDPELPASLRPRSLCSPSSSTCTAPDVKLNNPAGLFVDSAESRIYLSNTGSDPNCSNITMPCNAILVFHAADNLNHNAVPELVLSSTALNIPQGLTVDLERNILYVANNGGHSVLAFKNIKGLTGSVTATPDAQIAGTTTQLNAPVGVAIDSGRDIMYVLNQGTPEILVFEQASTRDGDSPPTRILSGGSFMQTPSALFLDPQNDLLYVADRGADAIYIFTGASEAQGEAAHRTVSGDKTTLNQPTALFADTTR